MTRNRSLSALLSCLIGVLAVPAPASADLLTLTNSGIARYDEFNNEFMGYLPGTTDDFTLDFLYRYSTCMTADPDGNLYIGMGLDLNIIIKYDWQAQAFVPGVFTIVPANPLKLEVGPDGDLFVNHGIAQDAEGYLRAQVTRYDRNTGQIVGIAAIGHATRGGFTFGPDNDLFFATRVPESPSPGLPATQNFYRAQRWDISNRALGLPIGNFAVIGDGNSYDPVGMEFGFPQTRDLFVAVTQFSSGLVLRFDGETGLVKDSFTTPSSAAITGFTSNRSNGDLYIADATNRIYRYRPGTQGGEFHPTPMDGSKMMAYFSPSAPPPPPASAAPEPSSLWLLGLAVIGLAKRRRP